MNLKLRRPRDAVRGYPGNRDDWDVVDQRGQIVGRILKPGGGEETWLALTAG